MGYNTYRGIETARNCMSDAIKQMENLHLLNPIHQDLAIVDYEDNDDGTPPNEYEMRALPGLVRSCVEVIELYLEAVSNGHIEATAKVDFNALKEAIEMFES